jgi:HEAT repeat protein
MRLEYVFGRNGVFCLTMFDGEGDSSQPLYKRDKYSSQTFFKRYKIVADELVCLPHELEPNQMIHISGNTLTLAATEETARLERKSANESVAQAIAYAVADLKSTDVNIRGRALEALRYAGPEARAGVPNLIAMLDSADQQLALEVLANIGPQEKQVVPALVEVLKGHDEPWMRVFAARELARFGPDAKAAVPALRECAQSSDKSLAQSAADALKRIDHEAD